MLVDSGNLLFKKMGTVKDESAEIVTAEAIASAYAAMKFDGVGIGTKDLSGGTELLLATGKRGVPWLSANIYNNKNSGDTRIFEAYRIVDYGNLKIAIIAVTGRGVQSDEFVIKDADEELSALLPELDSSVDIIILLSNLTFQQTAQTVNRFKQIDIAVTADPRKGNLKPAHSGNAILLQTASRGQYLGVLDAKWRDQRWTKNKSTETAKLKQQLKSISMQLNQLHSLPPGPKAEKTALLEKHRQKLLDQIKELENDTAPVNQLNFSTYRCRFLPLSAAVRKDPGVEQIVRTAQNRIKEITRAK